MQEGERLYQRFIHILGVDKRSPSLLALSELLKAHQSVIPFENISKLFYRDKLDQNHMPAFDQYLSGIEDYHFGGTCYSNNYYFFRLLGYLGYQVQLCSADMDNPGVHMLIQVTLEEKDYLVDVGYAAPFQEAIPLHLKEDHTLISGRDRFVIKPRDDQGCTTLLMFRDEEYKHGYTIRSGSRNLADFKLVIANSFLPDATFLRSLLITKYISGRFCTLHNLEYTEVTGTEINYQHILDAEELGKLVEEVFMIPVSITAKILAGMEFSGDAWN